MERKITFLKEKQVEKEAQKNFDKVSNYVQDPIRAKFVAFQKTKREINPKDLL